MKYQFSTEQRERIIRDIAHWKAEQQETLTDIGTVDFEGFIDQHKSLSDDELKEAWDTTVGEWLGSHRNLSIPSRTPRDEWIRYQFDRLLDGMDTEYDFRIDLSLHEYLDEIE